MGLFPLTIFRNQPLFYRTVSISLASEASKALLSLQICGKMRYHMSSLAASPVRHQGVRPALTGRTGSRKRSPYPSLPVFGGALLAWWRAFRRFSTKPALFLAAPLLLASHAPPVIFFLPPRPRAQRERGKVWLEQLVALATLCATAADWNRNWPIHVSLQAGSGPCLVLTDYLISIQMARVSAPLLRCGKATSDSLFLKAPRALLSSPISCLNYAPFCAVVVFFLPSLLLSDLPFFFSRSRLTICFSLYCFPKISKFEV